MSKIQCLNCGADLPALDGSPCPKCGAIADKGRVTDKFQTLRKGKAKAEYVGQTKRRVGKLEEFYREHPKFALLHIALVILIGIMTTSVAILLSRYMSSLSSSVLSGLINIGLSILVVCFVRPRKEKHVFWPK